MSLLERGPTRLLLVLIAAGALSACQSLNNMMRGDRVDYQSATRAPSLEVPPDLTQLRADPRFQVPEGAASAAQLQRDMGGPQGAAATAREVAPSAIGDLRMERAGSQRWLVTPLTADQLLPQLRQFWLDNGFVLTTDDAKLGLLETDWAENRADLPQDVVRRTLGRVFGTFYSTGELDRFRTRIERRPEGGTEVYVSHRGMAEVVSGPTQETTVWQPREPDPELEAEFLQRLMVKLGAPADSAQDQVSASGTRTASRSPERARVIQMGENPVLQVDDGFDRAWQRVGLSLDRTGFTVEDRDRSQGIYYVRYVPPGQPGARGEPGFLGRLFRRESTAGRPDNYRIALRTQGSATIVSVLTQDGSPAPTDSAQRIVTLLASDLR